MEGPTPVSALIHAATMVTAGVYLIARTNPLFELAPDILHLAAILGGVTILVAGLIALVQTDIKRVIAYSTMSQIGYMFVGVGLGAYGAGMFHLMTHAFFKALLFMAAGIVIHALAGEQDIRKMGGLGRALPLDVPVLPRRQRSRSPRSRRSPASSRRTRSSRAPRTPARSAGALWGAGAFGAFLTALYTFRLLFIVFRGEPSGFVREHLHRSVRGPASRWSGRSRVLAVLVGRRRLLQVPGGWHGGRRLARTRWPSRSRRRPAATAVFSALAALGLALAGIGLAWSFYGRPERRSRARPPPLALGERLRSSASSTSTRPTTSSFYEPASRSRRARDAYVEAPLFLRSLTGLGGGVRAPRPAGSPPPRPASCAPTRSRSPPASPSSPSSSSRSPDADDRSHRLPFAGALAPLAPALADGTAAGGLALLVALGELALWVGAVVELRLRHARASRTTRSAVWFADLGVSYKVGLYDFSLWLVGLTAVVAVASIGYGLWAGRERARAYFGLLLFLDRRDGRRLRGPGPAALLRLLRGDADPALRPDRRLGRRRQGRRDDQVHRLHDGGLAPDARRDHRVRALDRDSFDMTELGTSDSTWIFLGFVVAFAVKAPLWPFHGWLPDAYREAPPEVAALLSGVISKTAAYGLLRIVLPSFPEPVADWRDGRPRARRRSGSSTARCSRSAAPDVRGVIAYSSLAQMCLIVIGLFAVNDSGLDGALLQMVNHGLISASLFLLAGCVERRSRDRRPRTSSAAWRAAGPCSRRSSSRPG